VTQVIVIGGGLAGLAAAAALAPRGFRVTLLESRGRLGGRAGSFTDPLSGQLIDTCQHVSMGCCTNLAHFFRTVGIDRLLQPQPCLHFMTRDRRVSRLQADGFPAPLHLARSFLGAHYLTAAEKLRIAWGLARLARMPDDWDPPFLDWLRSHGQTPRTIDRFWGLVLTSALNETPDRLGLRYARKVFLDGFLRHRRGFEVELPVVPLGRLYGRELQDWLGRHAVRVLVNRAVQSVEIERGRVTGVRVRQSPGAAPFLESEGNELRADVYVAAVPFDRLLTILPPALVEGHPYFANLRNLETSPITSVHVWFDRAVTPLPHVVLIDCTGQWVFNRGPTVPGEHYLQVVVSAARQFRGLGQEEVRRQVISELQRLFPAARKAVVCRSRVITEHSATFSAVPGVDRWRPPQTSPVSNLFVAGDWTATGWPATMEGAVRSGYLAAEAVLKGNGICRSLVQPDLG
jgi:squalene-associated FAD-dependent desaturase